MAASLGILATVNLNAATESSQGILQAAFLVAQGKPQVRWGFELAFGLNDTITESSPKVDFRKLSLEEFAKIVGARTDYSVQLSEDKVLVKPKADPRKYTFPVSDRVVTYPDLGNKATSLTEMLSLITFSEKPFKLFDTTTNIAVIPKVWNFRLKQEKLSDALFAISKFADARMWVLQLVEVAVDNKPLEVPRDPSVGTVQLLE